MSAKGSDKKSNWDLNNFTGRIWTGVSERKYGIEQNDNRQIKLLVKKEKLLQCWFHRPPEHEFGSQLQATNQEKPATNQTSKESCSRLQADSKLKQSDTENITATSTDVMPKKLLKVSANVLILSSSAALGDAIARTPKLLPESWLQIASKPLYLPSFLALKKQPRLLLELFPGHPKNWLEYSVQFLAIVKVSATADILKTKYLIFWKSGGTHLCKKSFGHCFNWFCRFLYTVVTTLVECECTTENDSCLTVFAV